MLEFSLYISCRIKGCCFFLISASVKNIVAFPEDGKLWVNWSAPKESVSKYIIEWQEKCSNLSCPTEWQQEPGSKQRTFLKGNPKE